jgi:hypothetical protein
MKGHCEMVFREIFLRIHRTHQELGDMEVQKKKKTGGGTEGEEIE